MKVLLQRLAWRLRAAVGDTLAEARVVLVDAIDRRWEAYKVGHPFLFTRNFDPRYSRRYGDAVLRGARRLREEREHAARVRA